MKLSILDRFEESETVYVDIYGDTIEEGDVRDALENVCEEGARDEEGLCHALGSASRALVIALDHEYGRITTYRHGGETIVALNDFDGRLQAEIARPCTQVTVCKGPEPPEELHRPLSVTADSAMERHTGFRKAALAIDRRVQNARASAWTSSEIPLRSYPALGDVGWSLVVDWLRGRGYGALVQSSMLVVTWEAHDS